MDKYYHSVSLYDDRCMGCTTCMKNCPSGAVRLFKGKALIISERCTDCAECARVCLLHAIRTERAGLDSLERYKYRIALPDPSFYTQFNSIQDVNVVLTAILKAGFHEVFEVSEAAEIISALTKEYIKDHQHKWPIISTNCPSVVREIRTHFPRLVNHLLPILPPQEVAGMLAKHRAMDRTGLSAEEIGVFYFSPCSAKITNCKVPLGMESSYIDEALAIKDIYPQVLAHMKEAAAEPQELSTSGRLGLGWASSGGEARACKSDNYLYADGMREIIRVLEDLEDEKMNPELQFIELTACNGGCVGGILQVENTYAARAKVNYLKGFSPKTDLDAAFEAFSVTGERVIWNKLVEYENVLALGESFIENMQNMEKVEEIFAELPQIDCGFCGAPTCKIFAEDVVRGKMKKTACLYQADEEDTMRRIRRIKEIHKSGQK